MKYQEQREAFKRLLIQQGICKLEQLNEALPFGCSVPQPKIDKWLNRMLEVPDEFCEQRRYVNRFKLGADPEFIFVKNGERFDAKNLKLQQGLAFGMDNNGRLTEIRPYPSRSALNVTASILAALRWMVMFHPQTLLYDWCAGAFLMGDGLGGHVHFGRKRPGRDLEVKALDCIEEELLAVRAYPIAEVLRRRQGDQHNQHYGMPGDIRKQLHGYEYRTFPSWLDSPELAFLTITLSKLVVHNPTLAQGYIPLQSLDRHFQRIRNLLAYYKDVDDDARLALMMISKKFPVHLGGDFKSRWGISSEITSSVRGIQVIPSSVKPSGADILEMFECLSGHCPLKPRLITPNWNPLAPPVGYQMMINLVNTHGAKGLGELVWDVCTSQDMPWQLMSSREFVDVFFTIPKKLAESLPNGWQKFCNNKIRTHGHDNYIFSSEKGRDAATFAECRRVLLETVLPFWRVSAVKADSYQQWKSTLVQRKQKREFAGQVLSGDLAGLPIKL